MARESLALKHARAEAASRQMFEDVSALLHTQDQAAAPIGQELAHVNGCFESRPCCLEISAQQDATTSGRVMLCCELMLESRPEERVQQFQVWRSGRLEDDVPLRAWHVFFIPRLGLGTGMRPGCIKHCQRPRIRGSRAAS